MAKGQLLNLTEASAMSGVHRNTFMAWVRRGLPYIQKANRNRGVDWQFDSACVIEWREEQAALNAVGDITALDIDEARRRKVSAEAAICELNLSKARGDVISLAEVSVVWLDIVSAARSRLLSIPAKMAAILSPKSDPMEIRGLLEAEIEESLDELSRFEQGDVAGSDSDSQATG